MQYTFDADRLITVPTGVMDVLTGTGMQQREHALLHIDYGSDTCGIYVPEPLVPGTYRWAGSLPIGLAYIITRVLGQTLTLRITGDCKWICLFKQPTTLELCKHTALQITGRLQTRSSRLAERLHHEATRLGLTRQGIAGYFSLPR